MADPVATPAEVLPSTPPSPPAETVPPVPAPTSASAPPEAAAPAEAVDAPDDEAEAPAPKPAAAIPYKGKVDFPPAPYVQVLAVRSGPSTNYPIIARLPEGSTVTVVKVQGSWGELSRGGWSSLSYVDKI